MLTVAVDSKIGYKRLETIIVEKTQTATSVMIFHAWRRKIHT